MEIENSGMTPKSRINSGTTNVRGDEQDDENKTPVMSATSFPNQMWQPDMANWEGDER